MQLHRCAAPAASPSARVWGLLLASIAALVVTTFDAQAAPAAQFPAPVGVAQAAADGAEFGARKRYRARRGNSAAGLAMMGMMAGTIGAVIASQQRRDAYRRAYYYDEPYGYGYGYGHRHVYRQPYAYHAPRAYHGAPVYHQPRGAYRHPNPAWHDRLQRVDPQNPNAANPTGVPRIGW